MRGKCKKIFKAINSNGQLKLGLFLLCILVSIAVFAPVISGRDPRFLYDDLMAAPGGTHLLGTDRLGRDMLAMITHGTRISLMIGVVAAAIAAVLGTALGAISGYVGGKVDLIISEFINIFVMIPTFFLILMVIALFGSDIYNVMIVVGLTSWVGNARLMRAQAMSLKQKTFIKSARVIGENDLKILFKHIIPNGIFPVIANTTMNISMAILIEAGLSFLGLGDPNVVSWGQIINSGSAHLTSAWWISVLPGIMVIFTVLTFFLIGDGLNVVLSPKLENQTGGK